MNIDTVILVHSVRSIDGAKLNSMGYRESNCVFIEKIQNGQSIKSEIKMIKMIRFRIEHILYLMLSHFTVNGAGFDAVA